MNLIVSVQNSTNLGEVLPAEQKLCNRLADKPGSDNILGWKRRCFFGSRTGWVLVCAQDAEQGKLSSHRFAIQQP